MLQMKHIIPLIVFVFLSVNVRADNDALLNSLDSLMNCTPQIYEQKQMNIDLVKRTIPQHASHPEELLDIYHRLYDEYYVFQQDSAMLYINKEISLADSIGNKYHSDFGRLRKAELLAIGGLYAEAIGQIKSIDEANMDTRLGFKYNKACFRIYQYWSAYCNDRVYGPKYIDVAKDYLRKAIGFLDKKDPAYNYYMGEYYSIIKYDAAKAMDFYLKAMDQFPVSSRTYAMASYAIASNYSAHGNMEKYEEYIIKACISDLMNCTRENLALQDLALYLYNRDHQDIRRAERYINFAMDDATGYNNRLRILEISQKLPVIVASYREKLKSQNDTLRIVLVCLSFLAIVMVVLLYMFFRQNKQLSLHRQQLSQSNELLTTLNDKLHTHNGKLLDINTRREYLAKLYIDLCAQYIARLNKFEIFVQRKIKANQVQDLMNMASSSRLSEEDAAAFVTLFDKAFIDLYPTFVDEFNALMKDDCRIIPKQKGSLTTELRIFALIRLGVKESSEIASLLFYTPRTIYNYRSSVKNKAKNRDTFEDDITQLCTVK